MYVLLQDSLHFLGNGVTEDLVFKDQGNSAAIRVTRHMFCSLHVFALIKSFHRLVVLFSRLCLVWCPSVHFHIHFVQKYHILNDCSF